MEIASKSDSNAYERVADEEELRPVYDRVIKCVTCRANNLPCDEYVTCTECEHNGIDCIRRHCRHTFHVVGYRCEQLCDRLHYNDVQKVSDKLENSATNNDKIEKRKRELEDDGEEEKDSKKVLKATMSGQETSIDESERDHSEEVLCAAKRQQAKVSAESEEEKVAEKHEKDDKAEDTSNGEVKNLQVGIAYESLADEARTMAEDLEVPE
jgi:hypothetical protein